MSAKGPLTHWGRVTHICVSKLSILASDNGLSPGRRQAIIWTNAGMLLIGPLRTNFNEMLIKIHTFSFKKMHLKMSSGKWRPFCLGLNVLITEWLYASNYIYYRMGEITCPFPNFNCAAVEVWEWLCNVISNFTGHVITYPCWAWS